MDSIFKTSSSAKCVETFSRTWECPIDLLQTLYSCAGVLRCRNTRNSDAAISRSRKLHHRQGHARKYLPTAQLAGAARGSIFPQRALGRPRHHAEADPCRRRRDFSQLCILVVSEASAPPRRRAGWPSVDGCERARKTAIFHMAAVYSRSGMLYTLSSGSSTLTV